MATAVFSAFFKRSGDVCGKKFPCQMHLCFKATICIDANKNRASVFLVITWISLIVLDVSVEPRKGEARVCIDRTEGSVSTLLFHGGG